MDKTRRGSRSGATLTGTIVDAMWLILSYGFCFIVTSACFILFYSATYFIIFSSRTCAVQFSKSRAPKLSAAERMICVMKKKKGERTSRKNHADTTTTVQFIRPHAVSFRSTFPHWSAGYHSPSNFSEEDNTERMKLLLASRTRARAHETEESTGRKTAASLEINSFFLGEIKT